MARFIVQCGGGRDSENTNIEHCSSAYIFAVDTFTLCDRSFRRRTLCSTHGYSTKRESERKLKSLYRKNKN